MCGHYECGGVRASMANNDHGLIENWIMGVKEVAKMHSEELLALGDDELIHRRLVELNVQEQCLKVTRAREPESSLQHTCVFSKSTFWNLLASARIHAKTAARATFRSILYTSIVSARANPTPAVYLLVLMPLSQFLPALTSCHLAPQLYNTPVLQKAHAEKGGPHVHGMVFDVGEGLVKELDVDFKSLVQK